MPRSWLVPVAVAVVGVALAFAAIRGQHREGLALDIGVLSAEDAHSVGAITTVRLQVANRSGRTVVPHYSVQWFPYPLYWRTVSGPPELSPDQEAVYVIEAPDAASAVPKGIPFRVRVNDGRSIVYAVSEPINSGGEQVAVVNPSLRLWGQPGPGSGLSAPFGWQVYKQAAEGDEATVAPVTVDGVDAVRFMVAQDGVEDPGGWAHTGLLQEVPFPEAPLMVLVNSVAAFAAADAGWPLTAFGLEVSDGENPLLWFLFQQSPRGDLSYDLPNGQHIEVIDVPEGVWIEKEVDVAALYERLHWAPQERVLLKAFIGAASPQRAQLVGYLREVRLAGTASVAAPRR